VYERSSRPFPSSGNPPASEASQGAAARAIYLDLVCAKRGRGATEYAATVRPTWAFLCVFFAAASARAQSAVTYSVQSHDLNVSDAGVSKSISLPCEGKAVLAHETKIYVACGDYGVVVLSAADPANPEIEGQLPVTAVGFFVVDGRVWVRTQSQAARPLFSDSAASAPVPPPVPVATAPIAVNDTRGEKKKEAEERSLIAPPRFENVASLHAETALFVPLSTLGMGVMFNVDANYRFSFPLAVHGQLNPLGMGFADTRNIVAATGGMVVSLDTRYFEVGLGPGGMTINKGVDPTKVCDAQGEPLPCTAAEAGFALSFFLRVGAVDGISATAQTEMVVIAREVRGDQWDFGGFRAIVEIPVAQRWLLLLRGGGSNVGGWVKGDIAIRYRGAGQGGRRSLFVIASAGGAGLFFSDRSLLVWEYGGPALGGGLEWRP